MITNNYNAYNSGINNVPYGSVKSVMPEKITEKLPENLQNVEAKDIANNNEAVAAASGINPKSALLTLPVYAGFVGLRTLNDTKGSPFTFAGEYEKTTLGKLAKAGDKISNSIGKIIPEKVRTNVPKSIQNAKSWILEHSAIARSLANTPLKYESSMAKNSANGIFGRVLREDGDALFTKGYSGGLKGLQELFNKNNSGGEFWKSLVEKGINSKTDEEAVKMVAEAFQELGDMPVKSKTAQQFSKEIIEALSKSNQAFKIGKWGKFPIEKVPVLGKFMTLNVPMSEYANKIRVASGISGNELKTAAGAAAVGTTVLGRAIPSVFAKMYEGLTSDFIGGKIAPIIQAYFIASAGIKAAEAPKGKKLATFMDENVGTVTYLITMPVATKMLAHLGGLKYLGINQKKGASVDTFRNMIKELNGKIDAKTISRGEYVNEVKNIKNYLKGETKFWQKPLRWLGNIIGSNYKAETIKPFISDIPADASKFKSLGMSVSNKIQSLGYGLKTGKFMGITPGGLLRFGLVMFALSPMLTKPIKWVVNKIFGEPYDKDKEAKAQENQNKNPQNNPFVNMSDEELVKLLSNNQELLQQIQNNPELMKEIQNNPQKLYEMLQQGQANNVQSLSNTQPQHSSMLQNYINRNANSQNQIQPQGQIQQTQTPALNQVQGLNLNENAKMPAPSVQHDEIQTSNNINSNKNIQRNYIPSSKPVEFTQQQTQEDAKFNAILADMDNTVQKYSKYTF